MTNSVQTTRLESGLRIVTHHIPYVETAALGIWVDTGARWENVTENGLSHLLEHMAFKGTTTRSARQIAEEIEAVGGILNAYTSRENTAYYAHVLRDNVPLAINLLADILQNSVFDPSELQREREVILQEIGEAHDTPDDLIYDMMQETAFPDQAVGRPILGTKSRVLAFEQRDLFAFMNKHYTPPRMVVAAAGAVEHEHITARVAQVFNNLTPYSEQNQDPMRYEGGEFLLERDLEQVHLTLSLPGVGYDDPDYYATQVLNTLAGGGMSSRLFQEIREKRGLVYSVYTFANSYTDGGLFGVYAGTSRDHMDDLTDVLTDELNGLTQNITDAELNRAIAQLKAGLLMAMESISVRCEQLARHILIFGRPVDKAEMITRIESVTADSVANVASRILQSGRPTVAALGPVAQLECIKRLQTRLV